MISKEKQYRTRDGREVRIYATDGEGMCSVHGAIKTKNGKWSVQTWTEKGFWDSTEDIGGINDLVEIRPRIKREYWLALFDDGDVMAYPNEEEARDSIFKSHLIALVKRVVECEEGEGL